MICSKFSQGKSSVHTLTLFQKPLEIITFSVVCRYIITLNPLLITFVPAVSAATPETYLTWIPSFMVAFDLGSKVTEAQGIDQTQPSSLIDPLN